VASDLRLRHASVRTPLGRLTVVASGAGILATDFAEDRSAFLAWSEDRFEARAVRDPRGLTRILDEARAYFAGELRRFRTPVDLSPVPTPFFRAVYRAAIAIPYGEMRTYGDVAAGHALRVCPIELWIPCHRVVPAGPGLGTYGGHPDRREFLLRLEGAI
jgi:methylated-DNA-[protein]-cysteine S-methyltransferase